MKKIIFLFLIITVKAVIAGEHSFSFNIELNSTAINRALQQQYNDASFPKNVSGSVSGLGITYNLTLDYPSIEFVGNFINIIMKIQVNSNVFTEPLKLVIKPSIGIPQASISTSQVKAELLDLPNKVNELSIPDWLKSALIAGYNSYEPWMYPSKLIAELSTPFLDQRGVSIDERPGKGIVLGWGVSTGMLSLVITTNLISNLPSFEVTTFRGEMNGVYHNIFNVRSNIKVRIVEVILQKYEIAIWHGYPNVICDKNSTININMGELSNFGNGGCYQARVLYEIDETFYLWEYGCVNYTDWSGPSNKVNE